MKRLNLVIELQLPHGICGYPLYIPIKADHTLVYVHISSARGGTVELTEIDKFITINAFIKVWTHIDDVLQVHLKYYNSKSQKIIKSFTVDYSSSIEEEFYMLVRKVSHDAKSYLK